jgi:hypothetical protein
LYITVFVHFNPSCCSGAGSHPAVQFSLWPACIQSLVSGVKF